MNTETRMTDENMLKHIESHKGNFNFTIAHRVASLMYYKDAPTMVYLTNMICIGYNLIPNDKEYAQIGSLTPEKMKLIIEEQKGDIDFTQPNQCLKIDKGYNGVSGLKAALCYAYNLKPNQ
jgi:hypothetical protein